VDRIEVNLTTGVLRQPGMWGKVLHANGSITDVETDKEVQMSVTKTSRKFSTPNYPYGSYLLFGQRGYSNPGQLASSFILLRCKDGQAFDWESKPLKVRCYGTGGEVVAQSESDLKPIYDFLEKSKYAQLERLRSGLKQEGVYGA
jgi:hypothetical protein